MSASIRTLLSWSSGKDSAWTLYQLQRDPQIELVGLFTTFNSDADRVAMHAVRRELVRAQASAAGLPLFAAELPWPCSNEEYELRAGRALGELRDELGVQQLAFGDLYLEDVRAYRERQAKEQGLEPLFPLWQTPTAELSRRMVAGGLRAVLTCVDPQQLPAAFAGRQYDDHFLDDIPANADPCGEGGEFHTFVYAGPMFANDIAIKQGPVIERGGFVYADVLPI